MAERANVLLKEREKKTGSLGQGGFTLLEMLLVICIIGVLAAIAVPKFAQSMTLANTSKIQADLSTLNTAVSLYKAEKGFYPQRMNQLKDYILDIEALKPPTGSYFLRTGTVVEKAGENYVLTAGEHGETQATLDGHKLSEFGRKEDKDSAQGGS